MALYSLDFSQEHPYQLDQLLIWSNQPHHKSQINSSLQHVKDLEITSTWSYWYQRRYGHIDEQLAMIDLHNVHLLDINKG